jgi:hypothetical protein
MSIKTTNRAFWNRTRNLSVCIYKICVTHYAYGLLSLRFFAIYDGSVGTVNKSRGLNMKHMCRRGRSVYYVIFYVWVLVSSFFDVCVNLK